MREREAAMPLVASDAVQRVIDHVDTLLSRGELKAGQRLTEAKISADLGIGRAPVREAVRILAGEGVIDLKPNSGARVRIITRERLVEMLELVGLLMVHAVPRFLEQKNLPYQIRRLRTALTVAPDGPEAMRILEAFQRFNGEIITGSRNSMAMEVMKRIHFSHYNPFVMATIPLTELRAALAINGEVADALAERDAAGARATLDRAGARIMGAVERHRHGVYSVAGQD